MSEIQSNDYRIIKGGRKRRLNPSKRPSNIDYQYRVLKIRQKLVAGESYTSVLTWIQESYNLCAFSARSYINKAMECISNEVRSTLSPEQAQDFQLSRYNLVYQNAMSSGSWNNAIKSLERMDKILGTEHGAKKMDSGQIQIKIEASTPVSASVISVT